MSRFINSLAFKIGGTIVLVEVIVLAIAGVIYLNNFSTQVDSRLETAVSLPGKLMNAGLLDFNAVNNAQTIRDVVGEDVRNALIVATNNMVFFSTNPDFLGQHIDDLETIDRATFDSSVKDVQPVLRGTGSTVTYVSPVFGPDGRTPRFFIYVEAGNAEAIAQKNAIASLFLLGTGITVIVTSFIIFLMLNGTVLKRVHEVVRALKRMEEGDLAVRITDTSSDEIGELQRGVNSMAAQLQSLVSNLEERVAARTHDLRIAADVSLRITTLLDIDDLLAEIVRQTAQGFSLYHASVFLYDEKTSTLNYQAGSGAAGEMMKAEHKHFDIEDVRGLVPRAAQSRKAVVVNNVATDPKHFHNPHLPDTRSEAALPMVVGNRLIGVIDLQSERLERFQEEDLRIMTLLAEQVGIAVQNAHLYANQVKYAAELQALDNMKSQFLASMSHELRTPLNAILNFAKFILMGIYGSIEPKQKDALEKIISSAQHLLSLINDVLDVTKIESGMMQLFVETDVNLQEELGSVIATAETLLSSKPVALIQAIDLHLPLMVGDKRRIRQILLNIVSNACKFTETGSVTLSVKNQGDEILFAVKDTGPGIAAQDLGIIFEPFQQSEHGIKHAGGTGLGLPISKKLVEAHYGQLWVESEIGLGSTFFVRLPIASPRLTQTFANEERV